MLPGTIDALSIRGYRADGSLAEDLFIFMFQSKLRGKRLQRTTRYGMDLSSDEIPCRSKFNRPNQMITNSYNR